MKIHVILSANKSISHEATLFSQIKLSRKSKTIYLVADLIYGKSVGTKFFYNTTKDESAFKSERLKTRDKIYFSYVKCTYS